MQPLLTLKGKHLNPNRTASPKGTSVMKNLSTHPPQDNLKIAIFRERCEARALLWCGGVLSLQDAVDELQFWAVGKNLVCEIGQDEVQRIMAGAFEKRRIRL